MNTVKLVAGHGEKEFKDVVAYHVGGNFVQLTWYDGVKRIINIADYDEVIVTPNSEEDILKSEYPGYAEWYAGKLREHAEVNGLTVNKVQ